MQKKPGLSLSQTRLMLLSTLILDHPSDLRCQHIAGIWMGKRLVALGFNQKKSHSLARQFGKNKWSIYLHAEIDAIKNFLKRFHVKDLSRATLIVIRVKNGKLSNSKPCIGCQRAIETFNLKRVLWS